MTRRRQPVSALNPIGAEQPRPRKEQPDADHAPHTERRKRLMDILATLGISTDPEMMAQIRESERQLAQGESMSIAELEARLARDAAAPPAEG